MNSYFEEETLKLRIEQIKVLYSIVGQLKVLNERLANSGFSTDKEIEDSWKPEEKGKKKV